MSQINSSRDSVYFDAAGEVENLFSTQSFNTTQNSQQGNIR